MPAIEINGGMVEYELLGPADGKTLVLTPGGRFTKEHAGARRLADALARGGLRVLVWDRPNCGLSDVQFFGPTESHMRAETLGALIRELGLGPIVVAGGSGGARDSVLTTVLHPDLVERLFVWQPVGGVYSSMNMAAYYVLPSIGAARHGGIEAVLQMPDWAALVKANPRNEQRFRDLGADGLATALNRWLHAWIPRPDQAVPGVDDWRVREIGVPTTVVRSGRDDLDHPTRTSYDLHSLIPGSRFAEPPWAEDAWERSVSGEQRGEGTCLDHWAEAAPMILDFAGRA
jgi:pimeloyl-ACP methyl ester carboxylesterase